MSNFKKSLSGIVIKFRQTDWHQYAWRNLDKTKLLVPFRLFSHPIDTLNDMKYEKRSSLALANLMLLLYVIEEIVNYFAVGYLFSNNEASSFRFSMILLKTVGIVLAWSITNWSMCTLLEGDGTFKEIWIFTCYSLTPILLFRVPLNIISNVLVNAEGMFYNALSVIITGWTLLFLFLGMMVIHQFTVMRTVGSVILSLGMILIIAFLALLAFSIAQQMTAFAKTILTELLRR